MADIREHLKASAARSIYPFVQTVPGEVEDVLGRVDAYDRNAWAAEFSAVGARHAAIAREAEERGDAGAAAAGYLRAYAYYRTARYPTTNSPGKRKAFEDCKAMFANASRYFDPPITRVQTPFSSPTGGAQKEIVAYLATKSDGKRRPLVVMLAGADTWKEEIAATPLPKALVERGMAFLAVDMPGVGDAPVHGAADPDRMFTAILDWAEGSGAIDPRRVCLYGGSFGGYWATKIAHTLRARLRCAVNQGGPVHHSFTAEAIHSAQVGEYPFELAETFANAFGLATFEEWLAYAPSLSLLESGLIDQPSSPLLLINGVQDTIAPIRDVYLLLEHGSPKSARIYPTGHMGFTATTVPTMIEWIRAQLLD